MRAFPGFQSWLGLQVVPQTDLRILAVEPWLGGSHARFLETWRARSAHRVEVLGLPARHWRWRMEGGALTLAERAADAGPPPDVLLVSDYLDLPRFRGFLPAPWRPVPALVYFHENQLTFPDADGGLGIDGDSALGFSNILSLIAAEGAAFNSRFHLEEFGAAARALVSRLPRPRPAAALEAALARARVIPPGIEFDAIPLGPGPAAGDPLRVAWCHRWEHDKAPTDFLRAILVARERGATIELVLLGQRYDQAPGEVTALVARLTSQVRHLGYAEDRDSYARLLGTCDLVVSTARHEFYGISLLEAVAAGCAPLAPRRLAYPETLTGGLAAGLYDDQEALVAALLAAAVAPDAQRAAAVRTTRREALALHDCQLTAEALDESCAKLARAVRSS
jgi:glycosyltransferase involved in cell wall biosynthesis